MRGAAHFVRQLLWPFEPHFDSRIGPAWLSAQIPVGDQWQQCLHALHALDHWLEFTFVHCTSLREVLLPSTLQQFVLKPS